MIVEGEYTFKGPRQTVWDLLQDPEVLAKAMPGAKDLRQVGEDQYEGAMQVALGPITAAKFSLSVILSDKVPPERYAMEISGKGPVGYTRGTAHVELAEQDAENTRMSYRANLQIGGKVAAVGQRLLDSVGKMLTRKGLEALSDELEKRLASS
jgi:carbon monoxide dehydrogenase subunit G